MLWHQEAPRQELEENRLLKLALTRSLEIVGAAAARVSDEERSRLPRIPWAQITGMRNRLIHDYDFVELDILWQTVTVELPPLIGELQRILSPDS